MCREFSINGYELRVWVGRDEIMFVTCFSVSIVVSGFSYAAQYLRVCYGAGVCLDLSEKCTLMTKYTNLMMISQSF